MAATSSGNTSCAVRPTRSALDATTVSARPAALPTMNRPSRSTAKMASGTASMTVWSRRPFCSAASRAATSSSSAATCARMSRRLTVNASAPEARRIGRNVISTGISVPSACRPVARMLSSGIPESVLSANRRRLARCAPRRRSGTIVSASGRADHVLEGKPEDGRDGRVGVVDVVVLADREHGVRRGVQHRSARAPRSSGATAPSARGRRRRSAPPDRSQRRTTGAATRGSRTRRL